MPGFASIVGEAMGFGVAVKAQQDKKKPKRAKRGSVAVGAATALREV